MSDLRVVLPAEEPLPDAPLTLDEAFRRYVRYVAAIALKIFGRDDEVDDVVQDVFLAAHKGLRDLRDDHAIKGWLATVTVRLAGRRLRMRRLRSFFGLEDLGAMQPVAPGASPEQRALLASVYALLRKLPVADRLAWTLRHVEGMDLATVAQVCGCSLATAKRRISAAQHAIDEAVGDE